MKTVALRNLGCKVNAYETEGMQQILRQKGYVIVPFDTKADIYIVNTCSVTNIADHKSRQMLHKARALNPDAVIVACGCYVQTGTDKLIDDDSVDILIGNNEKKNIAGILDEFFERSLTETQKLSHVPDMNLPLEYEQMHVETSSARTRDFVKIQDGCNRFCSYCVIPYARGRVRSRTIEDVVSEVRMMTDGGCREVVLTGIHVSSYGTDRGRSELADLLVCLQDINGLDRIRLSSLEPGIITDDFVQTVSSLDKVCPHFHLSMQSGSKTVLKRMNRHYDPEEYLERVKLLRKAYDNPAITTDVIVGFPGETDEEFTETYEFIERVHFYELHVFKYSKRNGTKAAVMPGQIPERLKAERSDLLIELGDRLSHEYMLAHTGKRASLLTEEFKVIDGTEYLIGHTPEYICAGIPKAQIDLTGVDIPAGDRSIVQNRIFDGTFGDLAAPKIMLFTPASAL